MDDGHHHDHLYWLCHVTLVLDGTEEDANVVPDAMALCYNLYSPLPFLNFPFFLGTAYAPGFHFSLVLGFVLGR